MTDHVFLDTDMFIHQHDIDDSIKSAAKAIFINTHPSAISSFSIVEFKGNYIQDLILLHRKISDSDSFRRAVARIRSTGGRRYNLMLAILISWIDENFKTRPWEESRRELMTYLDTQITVSWEEYLNSVDRIFNDIDCSRFVESPDDDGEKWTAIIPKCNENNTKCKIIKFMESFHSDLQKLVNALHSLDSSEMTKELYKIRDVAELTISGKFPWKGHTCRQVGDLIIGLQSKIGQRLISSNSKEHKQLSVPLGYNYQKFSVTEIRSK
jgi:hypothetical protein